MAFDFPASPTENQEFTPAGGPTYVYKAPRWTAKPSASATAMADTAPAGATQGQLWYETDSGNMFVYYNDGTSSQWVQINASPPPSTSATADARNRIVNPCIQIAQEATSVTTHLAYAADQWQLGLTTGGAATLSQNPSGGVAASGSGGPAFLRLLCTTIDAALAATDLVTILQPIEGLDIADFYWGSIVPRPAVLRFTAYSNNGGTFSVSLRNAPSVTHSFVALFTLSANLWTDVVIPIPAPTAGAFAADNTAGVFLNFNVMVGSNYQAPSLNAWVAGSYLGHSTQSNFMATLNNDLRLANVGLYKDPASTGVPPPFEIPNQVDVMVKCLRYYTPLVMKILGSAYAATSYQSNMIYFTTPMRTVPVLTTNGDGTITNCTAAAFDLPTASMCRAYIQSTAIGTMQANDRTGKAVARM